MLEPQQELSTPVTYADIVSANYQNVPEDRKSQISYLEQLAQQTGIGIGTWHVLDMLKDAPIGDKRAINKVFFERVDALKSADTLSDEALLATLGPSMTVIEELVRGLKSRRITELQGQIDYSLDNAREAHNRVIQKLSAARDYRIQLAAYQGEELPIKNELLHILRGGFWKFQASQGEWLHFTTLNDVIMHLQNPQAKIDCRVNMGKYLLKLNVRSGQTMLCKHEKNLTVRGYYHTYVSTQGNICWGNGAETAHRYLTYGQFGAALDLLAAVLTNYYLDSTPYMDLREFWNVQEKAAHPEKYCQHCAQPHENCGCHICERCGGLGDDCVCHYCEYCDDYYYPDRCPDHWCPHCEDYERHPEECEHRPCEDCRNPRSECTCREEADF